MNAEVEQKIAQLVFRIEARRKVGMGVTDLEQEIADLKAEHGPRKVTGTSEITIPLPRSKG